jgi:hypothetical protein
MSDTLSDFNWDQHLLPKTLGLISDGTINGEQNTRREHSFIAHLDQLSGCRE